MSREPVTLDLARRLVAAQFPQWSDLPVTAVELPGWDNTTFRLSEDMSVRLPGSDSYALQVDKEHRWLPFLGERLPVPIPVPLARGEPAADFCHPWSVYRWLPGRPAAVADVGDLRRLASDLAAFLRALYSIEPDGGPPPGEYNFERGAHVSVYDAEARRAIDELGDQIDGRLALETWEAALSSQWSGPPVWVHGDVAASNLLIQNGRLAAVIDFGCCAVGDPACDLVIAWTFFDPASRVMFRRSIGLDDATWARARGWALWKAAILLTNEEPYLPAREVLDAVLAEHQSTADQGVGR